MRVGKPITIVTLPDRVILRGKGYQLEISRSNDFHSSARLMDEDTNFSLFGYTNEQIHVVDIKEITDNGWIAF